VMLFLVRDLGAPFGQALRIEGARVGSHETPPLSREARVPLRDVWGGRFRLPRLAAPLSCTHFHHSW
jgi:hypothetical protein